MTLIIYVKSLLWVINHELIHFQSNRNWPWTQLADFGIAQWLVRMRIRYWQAKNSNWPWKCGATASNSMCFIAWTLFSNEFQYLNPPTDQELVWNDLVNRRSKFLLTLKPKECSWGLWSMCHSAGSSTIQVSVFYQTDSRIWLMFISVYRCFSGNIPWDNGHTELGSECYF